MALSRTLLSAIAALGFSTPAWSADLGAKDLNLVLLQHADGKPALLRG